MGLTLRMQDPRVLQGHRLGHQDLNKGEYNGKKAVVL
jgi:hypothetical protein